MIALSTLRAQRLTVAAANGETLCPGCGKRTRDRLGTCSPCRRLGALDVTKLSTERIGALVAACRAELERRRDAIDAAIGGTP